jgi:hypothetical protein
LRDDACRASALEAVTQQGVRRLQRDLGGDHFAANPHLHDAICGLCNLESIAKANAGA